MSELVPDLLTLIAFLDRNGLCWKLNSRLDEESGTRVYAARVWRPHWPDLGIYGRKVRAADPAVALSDSINLCLNRRLPRRVQQPKP